MASFFRKSYQLFISVLHECTEKTSAGEFLMIAVSLISIKETKKFIKNAWWRCPFCNSALRRGTIKKNKPNKINIGIECLSNNIELIKFLIFLLFALQTFPLECLLNFSTRILRKFLPFIFFHEKSTVGNRTRAPVFLFWKGDC